MVPFKFVDPSHPTDDSSRPEDHHHHKHNPENQHAVFGKRPQVFRQENQNQGADDDPQDGPHTPQNNYTKDNDRLSDAKTGGIDKGGFGKFVPALVNVYTDLRDTGHDHPTAKSWSISIIQAVIDRESTKKESKPKEDLIRLIRDE